jgi:hypothetical protein
MAIYLMHVLAASGARVLLLRLGEQTLAFHLIAGVAVGLLSPIVVAMAIRGTRFEALLIPPARLSLLPQFAHPPDLLEKSPDRRSGRDGSEIR